MSALLKSYLFFCWFISFSVIDIGDWGLQLSWVLGMLLICTTDAKFIFRGMKIYIMARAYTLFYFFIYQRLHEQHLLAVMRK